MEIKAYTVHGQEKLFTVYTDSLQGTCKYGIPPVQLRHDLIDVYKN